MKAAQMPLRNLRTKRRRRRRRLHFSDPLWIEWSERRRGFHQCALLSQTTQWQRALSGGGCEMSLEASTRTGAETDGGWLAYSWIAKRIESRFCSYEELELQVKLQ